MSSSLWKRVKALFEEAASLPSDQQAAFLDQACGQDHEMRLEVESLLLGDKHMPSGFMQPRQPPNFVNLHFSAPDALVGQLIGQYEIKSVIASGGMGTVYEAEQQRPKRIVALKLMKASLASSAMLQRFKNETAVLARLQHPNIAQIFESGIHAVDGQAGLPFFAMEFVGGSRFITDYAKQDKLEVRKALEIFTQVCEAVHHGHQKGVIHRDLKPANILVDSLGQPKVIDFGVARATDLDVALTTQQTETGALIGTLQYMSPEQCEADPLGLDIRSDVYSLGVVLFELLTGQLPYEVNRKSIPSAARTICDTSPPRPSDIIRTLRGDRESIILKCLEKNPEQRYGSAGALAEDIRRHLKGEPVMARKRTWGSRAMHWVVQHPAICAAAATAIITSLLFVTVDITSRAERQNYRFYPSSVSLTQTENQSTAQLWAVNGDRLYIWDSQKSGIGFAKLVSVENEGEFQSLVIIGYTKHDESALTGSFSFFDAQGDRSQPLLQLGIDDEGLQLPTQVIDRGFTAAQFNAHYAELYDVFPDRPGAEIVAIFQHFARTQSCLRVYDFSGNVLYQVWLDADIQYSYWMDAARLLVLGGINGAAYWEERGYPDIGAAHPRVVVAIEPIEDFVSREYLKEGPGSSRLHPKWQKCIWPPELQDGRILSIYRLSAPLDRSLSGNAVAIDILVDASIRATVQWMIDEHGIEIPNTRNVTDEYKRNLGMLPDWNDPKQIRLDDLPPIKPVSDHVKESASPESVP